MGLPFESLLPYGIIVVMFGISGGAVSGLRHWQNDFNRGRHGIDAWDINMMERDRRLTGKTTGQTDSLAAPKDFALNSAWRLEKRFI